MAERDENEVPTRPPEWEREEQEHLPPRGTGSQDNQGADRRTPDELQAEEEELVSTGAGGRTTGIAIDPNCQPGNCRLWVVAAGGVLCLQHDVAAIMHTAEAVTGARVRDRRTGEETFLRAPLIISNIGPAATRRLIAASSAPPMGVSVSGARHAALRPSDVAAPDLPAGSLNHALAR